MTSSDLKWSARENLALINYLEQTNDRLFLKCQGMCQNEGFWFNYFYISPEKCNSQSRACKITNHDCEKAQFPNYGRIRQV